MKKIGSGLVEQMKTKSNLESNSKFTMKILEDFISEYNTQRNQIEEKRNYYTNKVFLELLDDSEFMGLCNYTIITGGQETIDYTQKRYTEINKKRNVKT